MEKLRIIVGGFLGLIPAGGVTWDYIQYPLGLFLMGHDVYYIEDTRLYPIYQKPGSSWDDCTSGVKHLQSVMDYFKMNNRWAYRDEASGKCFGLSETSIREICRTADLFINISCSTFMREEYMQIPKRILIDSDPMFTQIQYATQQLFTPGISGMRQLIQDHNYLFSFGENIGAADCLIPDCSLKWHTTRQPVCLDYWKPTPLPQKKEFIFTTLMNWAAGKKLLYNNQEWGQKDIEFYKVMQLPQMVKGVKFEMVVNQTSGTDHTIEQEKMEKLGWKILKPEEAANDWMDYKQFIERSSGEFSVAKETYVKAKTGWFSCRSACYLAAGRPVITQDTGWSEFIPTGKGLFAFQHLDEATDAFQHLLKDPEIQSAEARKIAEEYFESKKILGALLQIVL